MVAPDSRVACARKWRQVSHSIRPRSATSAQPIERSQLVPCTRAPGLRDRRRSPCTTGRALPGVNEHDNCWLVWLCWITVWFAGSLAGSRWAPISTLCVASRSSMSLGQLDPTCGEDDHVVANPLHICQQVRRQHERQTVCGEFHQVRKEFAASERARLATGSSRIIDSADGTRAARVVCPTRPIVTQSPRKPRGPRLSQGLYATSSNSSGVEASGRRSVDGTVGFRDLPAPDLLLRGGSPPPSFRHNPWSGHMCWWSWGESNLVLAVTARVGSCCQIRI